MADNFEVGVASGGIVFAADDIGSVYYPYVKLTFGPGDTATIVTATAGLPVAQQTGATFAVAGAAADGAALAGNPVLIAGSDGTNAQSISVTSGGLVQIHDAGGAITVDGTVGVSGTVTVDGSGVTQPVSHGALTELAAAINSSQVDVNIAASAATLTVASHAVTNAGTFATQVDGAALTALQLIDDTVATLGTTTYTETTTKGLTIGAVRRDADTTLVDTTNEIGPLQMDANGRLKVEAFSGETLPVSIAATVTTTIAAGTNNIGDVDVLSVIPGTTATSLGKAEDAQHASGDVGVMALGVRQSSQSDFGADNDYVPFSVDDDGGLRVSIVAGAGSGGTASADDADFTAGTTSGTPAMGVYESTPSSVTDGDLGVVGITQTRALRTAVEGTVTVGSHAVTNAGTFATQITGDALTALQLIDDIVYVDDTATHATGTSKGALFMAAATPTDAAVSANDIGAVAMTVDRKLHVAVMDALPAGTNGIGKLTANSGVDIGDVDVTSISAGTNAIGNVGLIGRTTGGLSMFKSIDLDESEEEVKATAGQIFSIAAFNRTAAPLYLKFYNLTAANTTVGSSTIVATFVVPANADSDGAGFIWNNEIGLAFSTAISAAVTTGVADNDTGAPGANDCVVMIGYV